MLEEFKKFAMRGNVADLAIGVIIGAAFGAIVNSLVADVLMPMIGAVTGGLDFSNYFVRLSSKVTADSLVRSQEAGRGSGVGQLSHPGDQFHHHRVGPVPGRQADEPGDASGGREGAAAHQAGAIAHRDPRPVESRSEIAATYTRRRVAAFGSKGATSASMELFQHLRISNIT
jgi:Large-conductance mechanosensitive channel, MscL